MITVSTHVLDSAAGRPATGMAIALETAVPLDPSLSIAGPSIRPGPGGDCAGRSWIPVGAGQTDADGRLRDWGALPLGPGEHRLIFQTGDWFASLDRECFYPEVIITFTVKDDGSHYHVPLLLAAYAYSTYRGS
jgi:5-hydroxyisourate hydrolase